MSKYQIPFTSDKRNSGSLSSPIFEMGNESWNLKKGEKIRMGVQIPPFQNITSSNNAYNIGGVADTITAGYYASANEISTALQTKLGGNYTVSYSSVTMRFTITNNAVFAMVVASGDLIEFLGFATGNFAGSITYTSTTAPNLYHYIVHIASNLNRYINKNTHAIYNINKNIPNNTIATVIINQFTPNYTMYNDIEIELEIKEDERLFEVSFGLLDKDGNSLTCEVPFTILLNISHD